jgi:paraquat-inducible protein B
VSKPVNPVAVGGFTVGALALLVVGLLMFGGGKFFNADKTRYVIFFDSSLNGLDIGAPVKMQGVKIGSVVDISLLVDPQNGKVLKPVVIEIDRKSFLGPGGLPFNTPISHEKQIENRDRLVAKGFRARLEVQSLLTGLLYVDLDKFPGKPAQFTGLDFQGLVELPGVPTTVDEIRNTVEEVVRKIRSLPLDEMLKDVADTLKDVRGIVGSEEAKRSTAALAKALEGMDKTMDTLNRNLEPLLKQSNQTVSNANHLMQDSRAMVQDVHREMKPVLASTDKTLNAATAALNKAQTAITSVQGTLEGSMGPDSSLNETLLALKDAAHSIKNLTDFLERHPEALISGKSHQ